MRMGDRSGIPDISPATHCTTAKLVQRGSLKSLYFHLLVGCYIIYSKVPAYCEKDPQPSFPFSAVPIDNQQSQDPVPSERVL